MFFSIIYYLRSIEIPKSIEGEDLSDLIKSPDANIDRTALVMNVCPFATEYNNQEYRGVRTSQYTYVCTPDGPSMMFDNQKDPYQMDNLIEKSEYDTLQKRLNKKLNKELKKVGDKDFKNREFYLEKCLLDNHPLLKLNMQLQKIFHKLKQ